jgi:hypothetical protein
VVLTRPLYRIGKEELLIYDCLLLIEIRDSGLTAVPAIHCRGVV